MIKTYKDVDKEKYEKLKQIAFNISKELFLDDFSKDSIYTFLHATVNAGLYEAEIDKDLVV